MTKTNVTSNKILHAPNVWKAMDNMRRNIEAQKKAERANTIKTIIIVFILVNLFCLFALYTGAIN